MCKYLSSRSLLVVAMASASAVFAQITVPTGQYDNNRTGANLQETVLNTSNVNQNSFGKLATWNVDGRVFAQPLYIPNVSIKGKTTNVVYVATEHNSVYAFDVNDLSAPALWTVNFGPSAIAYNGPGEGCPAYSAGPETGIFSTPVIDTGTGTIYAVSTSPDGNGDGGYNFFINAVDIQTGQPKFGGKQKINLSVSGDGYDSSHGVVSLNNNRHAQRTALLLNNGTIYAGFASCGPDLDPWHGWIAGYDAQDLTKQTALFNATPNGRAGGIWQSGLGAAGDAQGNVYFSTGNGTSDANDFGNSVVKMNATNNALNPAVSAYTPPNAAYLDQQDLDISAAGPVLIPGANRLVAAGKEGVVYLLDTNNMGNPVQTLQATPVCGTIKNNSFCPEIHGLVYRATSSTTGLLYVWGNSDSLRAYRYSNGLFGTTPVAINSSAKSNYAIMSLSANGTNSGSAILWATSNPNLFAFNADTLNELWDTTQNSNRDGIKQAAPWGVPTVADGRVYLPTWWKQVLVYGLLNPPTSSTLKFSNSSWTFSAQPIGQPSGSGHISVTNNGNSSVTFSNVTFTGANPADFNVTSNGCASLAPGAVCSVAFNSTPTTTGVRNANLTFTDTASGSPQSIPCQGTGSGGPPPASTLTFSNASWTFSSHPIGQTSGAGNLFVTNKGNSTATFSNVSFTGANTADFKVTLNTCSSLQVGATCKVSFNFTPTGAGVRKASLTFTDTASGSPQSIPVQGTGSGAAPPPSSTLAFSNANWTFGSHPMGETSGAGSVFVTNTGTSAVTFSSISFSGANPADFKITSNTCSSVGAGGTCRVSFNFTPAATGFRSTNLTFADNASGSPQSIPVGGTGR